MITDIEEKNTTQQLNKATLADYWKGYFRYKNNAPELYQIAQEKLIEVVENSRTTERPFIDAQQSIGKILADFSSKHCFHRQFQEQVPGLHANQVLGMHLYDIMVNDKAVWVYSETQHTGHLFPHATYFTPRRK